ncbi:MAG: D-glycerate dehydrogenase [Candidatus Paceibacterota bacterium]
MSSPKVYVTRKIPSDGLALLRDKGYEVDINELDRPLSKVELIAALKSKSYEGVLTLLNDVIDQEVLDAAPKVKIFANYTIGFDNFNIEAAKSRGVYLSNVPGGGADRVAEHVWAFILALSCRLIEGNDFMRTGKYCGWDPMIFHGTKIAGKCLGLVGAGRIGASVAKIGRLGFGMPVIYYDVIRNEKLEAETGITYKGSLEEVLKEADFVSLHVPLLESTKHLINAKTLKFMKKTAFLVNTSRGPVIEEAALVKALKNKEIAGAGLDVFECEPTLSPGLAALSNVVLTPHIASATVEARQEMSKVAALNIIDVLEGGKPRNLVYN